MSSNEQLIPTPNLISPEYMDNGQVESMTSRLTNSPNLRFRLRDALHTLDIGPAESLPYGYHHRPYALLKYLYRDFGIDYDPDEHSPQTETSETLGGTLLNGCAELRSDMIRAFDLKATAETTGIANFRKLPALFQYVAAYKVMDHLFQIGHYFTSSDRRERLRSYFSDHLGIPVPATEDILQSAAIVFANDTILAAIKYGDDDSNIDAARVEKNILMGPVGPENGLHLGYDLEQGVVDSFYYYFSHFMVDVLRQPKDRGWMDERDKREYREFWPKVNGILSRAISITGKPESEQSMWSSYLFGKAVFASMFEPHTVEGYDGGIDELGSWKEPLKDEEHVDRLKRANSWLDIASEQGFNVRGLDLARQAFAFDLINQMDMEIARGSKNVRFVRLEVIAKIINDMRRSNPDLSEAIFERSPLLKRSLEHQMDPWGFKFGTRYPEI